MERFHKLVAVLFIAVILAACGLQTEVSEPTEIPTATLTDTPMPISTPTSSSTSTTESNSCELHIEKISDTALEFTWSGQDTYLFYSYDNKRLEWRAYPDQGTSIDLQTVYPVLQDQVKEAIRYRSGDPPKYSISPSGNKVIFWENVYTRPTPTPAPGEVSLTEREWILDIYSYTSESPNERLITRVEGWIIDTYWSKDENFVYLIFDQLQIPGDYFLVQVDLVKTTKKILLYDYNEYKFDSQIGLSPNNDWIAFRHRKNPTTVHLLNLASGEINEILNLPEFDGLFWARDDLWILIQNDKEGSTFIVFDYSLLEVTETIEFDDRIEITGFDKPILSPDDCKLAVRGQIISDILDSPLYILTLCE